MKKLGKAIVVSILGWQLRRLQRKWHPKVVAVVGSYGKTSTKFAIAAVLAKHYKVRFQKGNYNDIVTVPLIFFDEALPNLLNVPAWTRLLLRNEKALRGPCPYDVAVLELGTDTPGDIANFERYLHVDLAVVTSIAYEHMAFFADLDAVAQEELAVARYSTALLVNTDLCAPQYLEPLEQRPLSYGMDRAATYRLEDVELRGDAYSFTLTHEDKQLFKASYQGLSKLQLYSVAAASAVANQLEVPAADIVQGLADIKPVQGRMQMLKGIRGSIILDETYNASPEAVMAALDTLYAVKAPQKIALLGSMNELGDYTKGAHTQVGKYCDPKQLDMVVTMGADANQFLAAAARDKGCTVHECTNPEEAGEFLRKAIKPKAAILAKGSETGIYAEEAVKHILANQNDAKLLVRQSKTWMAKKRRHFEL